MSRWRSFQDKVEKFLAEEKMDYVKCSGIYTRSGVLDSICCINGLFLGIEFKTENGQISELQCYNLAHICRDGREAFVFYPDEFEEFKDCIRRLKAGTPIAKDFAEEVNSLLEKEEFE